jgi:hypothetical protein
LEEGNYIQKNKTYEVRGTRQTHWKCQAQKGKPDSLDEWTTPIKSGAGVFYNKKRILKNFTKIL